MGRAPGTSRAMQPMRPVMAVSVSTCGEGPRIARSVLLARLRPGLGPRGKHPPIAPSGAHGRVHSRRAQMDRVIIAPGHGPCLAQAFTGPPGRAKPARGPVRPAGRSAGYGGHGPRAARYRSLAGPRSNSRRVIHSGSTISMRASCQEPGEPGLNVCNERGEAGAGLPDAIAGPALRTRGFPVRARRVRKTSPRHRNRRRN